MGKIRIGTRGSRLALKQAALVQDALSQTCGRTETELVILRTRGDRIQDRPLSEIGDKGVFASELEQALLSGQIDLAVHSAKDLPMNLADGLTIAAVLPRADVRDVLVVPRGGRTPVFRRCGGAREMTNADVAGQFGVVPESAEWKTKVFSDFPGQFCVGTGSRRRQLLAGKVWENVVCREIRGNVETRLRKLQEGSYDGILLAKAGLDRLGSSPEWESDFDFYPLSPEMFLPAACQGIIAVEAVEGTEAVKICEKITDGETALCFAVEREALAQLSADCSEAAAAWCRRERTARDLEATDASAAWDSEVTGMSAARGSETACTEARLLLDVMYADCRVRMTGAVSAEEGRRMAREAARTVKGRDK